MRTHTHVYFLPVLICHFFIIDATPKANHNPQTPNIKGKLSISRTRTRHVYWFVIQLTLKGIIQGGYCDQYARRQIKPLHNNNNHLHIYWSKQRKNALETNLKRFHGGIKEVLIQVYKKVNTFIYFFSCCFGVLLQEKLSISWSSVGVIPRTFI